MPSGARSARGRVIIGSAGEPVFAEYIANTIHKCNVKISLVCLYVGFLICRVRVERVYKVLLFLVLLGLFPYSVGFLWGGT